MWRSVICWLFTIATFLLIAFSVFLVNVIYGHKGFGITYETGYPFVAYRSWIEHDEWTLPSGAKVIDSIQTGAIVWPGFIADLVIGLLLSIVGAYLVFRVLRFVERLLLRRRIA